MKPLAAAALFAAAAALLPEALAQPSPGKRDRCERAQDPAYCEAQRAAGEGDCRGLARDEMRACVQERLPPRRPACARQTRTQRAGCEFYAEAVEACYSERGASQRACLEAHSVRNILREPFNPLDCAAPAPGLQARCAAWRRVELACATHAAGETRKCKLDFYREQWLVPIDDCGRWPGGRGECLVHDRSIALCRGREGAPLAACIEEQQGHLLVSEASCGGDERLEAERDYCKAYDRALERCVDNLADAVGMKRCMDDAIPARIKLALRATAWRRFGPVR